MRLSWQTTCVKRALVGEKAMQEWSFRPVGLGLSLVTIALRLVGLYIRNLTQMVRRFALRFISPRSSCGSGGTARVESGGSGSRSRRNRPTRVVIVTMAHQRAGVRRVIV